MFTIAFGTVSEYSRSRVPRPPQKRTTFIETSSTERSDFRERGVASGLACGPRAVQSLVEPGLAPEVPVLVGPQPVCQTSCWQLYIVVGEHLVLCDFTRELAALHQPLRKVTLGAHLFRVYRFAVSHVHSVLIEHLAGLEVSLGDGADLDHRPAERRCDLVTEQHDPCDGVRRLEVHEVIGGPERVQWPFAHLVQVE